LAIISNSSANVYDTLYRRQDCADARGHISGMMKIGQPFIGRSSAKKTLQRVGCLPPQH